MSEKPKSIWKKSWAGGRGLFFGWLILMAPLVVIFLIWTVAERTPINKSGDELKLFVVAGIGMTIIFLLATFIRWLFCWRNFKRSLFCLACFATLIALFYAEEDWRGWHDWNQFKHQWEAKGEKFDWQSIVPPPVPDDQNFAMQPIWVDSIKFEYGTNVAKQWYGKTMTESERTNLVDRLGISIYGNMYGGEYEAKSPHSGHWAEGTETDLKNWQQYYRDLASKTNEFPIAPQPQSPAQDVLLALSKYDSTIEELRQAGQLPYSRFPLEYDKDNPSAIMLPHLAMLKRSSQVLQLRAIAELQNGESEKALDDVKLMLRLTDAIRTEPFFISQLVRIAMLEECALQPTYEGLVEHKWSDAQLVELDSELVKLDFLADCQNVQKSEMFFSAEEANYFRRHRNFANVFAGMDIAYPDNYKFEFAVYHYMPGGWFYQSAVKNGRTLMEYSPAVNDDTKTISPALIRRADAAANSAVSFFSPLDSLNKMFGGEFQFMGSFLEKIAYAQSSVDLARVAIALERYRLAHGEFPESLDALSPQFMEKIPHDVIGGQPLHYRRTNDGQFVLYSVGWNETDDGGVVVLDGPFGKSGNVNISKGDWVWRYPAK